ncbi:MAG: hypothetical protein KBA40_02540 [Candidatus Peribacteraceae bacterium]|nr:hypothetical protein [Candidatus Peribacteraceae bacterium]MBP9850119.1 hypothetical protein [Candidatus Peribacteraceae bacterium]
MKNQSQHSMFALMLVSIAVPTVVLGVVAVSAASDISPVTKSTNHELFELRSFRLQQRLRTQDSVVPASSAEPARRAAPTVPCASDTEVTETEEASESPLIFEDLSMTQREILRKQLRIGGCPQDVLPGYRQLCESLLKQQQTLEAKTGLTNPHQ